MKYFIFLFRKFTNILNSYNNNNMNVIRNNSTKVVGDHSKELKSIAFGIEIVQLRPHKSYCTCMTIFIYLYAGARISIGCVKKITIQDTIVREL